MRPPRERRGPDAPRGAGLGAVPSPLSIEWRGADRVDRENPVRRAPAWRPCGALFLPRHRRGQARSGRHACGARRPRRAPDRPRRRSHPEEGGRYERRAGGARRAHVRRACACGEARRQLLPRGRRLHERVAGERRRRHVVRLEGRRRRRARADGLRLPRDRGRGGGPRARSRSERLGRDAAGAAHARSQSRASLRAPCPRGPVAAVDPAPRRDGHRQGGARPRDSRPVEAAWALRRGELRRHPQQPGRGAPVRPRARRVLRRGEGRAGNGPLGGLRHAPARRDRRPSHELAGRAPPRSAGG